MTIKQKMIEVSNNSKLTWQAADIISKLSKEELHTINQWLDHTKHEIDNKISQMKRRERNLLG